jgi:hypothetical protein
LFVLLTFLPRINAQTVLPLVEKNGLFFVSVQVNERAALLLLDTGARNTVVTPDIIDRSMDAAPIRTGAKLSGLGGSNSAIAESRIRIEVVPHNPIYLHCGVMKLPDYLKGADGLLGNDVLSNFRLTIDYKARTLTLITGRDK